MTSEPRPLDRLKLKMRASWMAGDSGQVARFTAKEAEDLVARLGIRPSLRVLDVACGTGNLAVPAARAGARVTGLDIAPNLLRQARQRAAEEDLAATFAEGDAEYLPFPDGVFDVAMSMFGAMFAPRPELVAAELLRVCRSGGRIAMANWTPESFIGKMFAVSARYIPPPVGIPAPVLWGSEDVVRQRFASAAAISMTRRTVDFDYPFPPNEVVQFYREHFGPTRTGFAKLDSAGRQAYATDLEQLFREGSRAPGARTVVPAEYLEIIAVKA